MSRRIYYSRKRRSGAIIIWCALMLVVLFGMAGLVIDGGVMMTSYRHAQNAADSAALAAAFDLMRGQSVGTAQTTGARFVNAADHNNIADTPAINIPPTQGPYAGMAGYAEAIVSNTRPTYFIHVLPGISNTHAATARAVAGVELAAAGEGVLALNPDARPGLNITGSANLTVEGVVYVNSAGGGLDEYGNDIDNGQNQTAINVRNNGSITATDIYSTGGVNDPDNFVNADGSGDNPLHTGSTLSPDPFLFMPTPTVANGVDNILRGAPKATNANLKLNNPLDTSGSPNYIEFPGTANERMVLQPGIYTQIAITGGKVRFVPGIYVLKPAANTNDTLVITGGVVEANGIMFYNTGSDYDPVTGLPDTADGDNPPVSSTTNFGGITINASMGFSGVNTSTYSYAPAVSTLYNGMLFYNRRWNTEAIRIEGNSAEGDLTGTIYAKWADVALSGQGTYDAQFVVGSLSLSGQGDVTIQYTGDNIGKAPRLYLVE